MNSRKQILLMLSCAGMEIIWCYAWVFFLTLSILGRPLSLLASTAIFAAACLATAITEKKAWRLYRSLLLHTTGFILLWFFTIHRFFYSPSPAFGMVWIADWFVRLAELQFFFIQFIFFLCLLLFWRAARAMVKRKGGYFSVCLQFDKGLGLLFLLLLVKFVAEQKGGLFIEERMTRYLIFAYFTFGMIAISLAGNQNEIDRSFRPGYHGMGIILGFLSFVLIAGAILTSLFLPAITLLADSAQSTLKDVSEPMAPVFVQIIRFIFSMGKYRKEVCTPLSDGSEYQVAPGDEISWAHGFGGVMIGVLGLIVLGVLGYLILLLIRWLLKQKGVVSSNAPANDLIYSLLAIVTNVVLRLWRGILSLVKKNDSAAIVYAKLLHWGRRSGLPVRAAETPSEYGKRLSHQLPELESEIDIIIEAFNIEIYGNREIDDSQLFRILAALRTMQSPRYWQSRIKMWFFQT
jgi:hypothetical protein